MRKFISLTNLLNLVINVSKGFIFFHFLAIKNEKKIDNK